MDTIFFSGKPEGKYALARRRHRCDIVKMDLKETGWEGVDWIPVTLDTPVFVQKYVVKVLIGLYLVMIGCSGGVLRVL
jgi:hypothetical protein